MKSHPVSFINLEITRSLAKEFSISFFLCVKVAVETYSSSFAFSFIVSSSLFRCRVFSSFYFLEVRCFFAANSTCPLLKFPPFSMLLPSTRKSRPLSLSSLFFGFVWFYWWVFCNPTEKKPVKDQIMTMFLCVSPVFQNFRLEYGWFICFHNSVHFSNNLTYLNFVRQ